MAASTMRKVFLPGAFDVFDARDEDAGIAGNEPARLDEDSQAQRLQQRHQPRRVDARA